MLDAQTYHPAMDMWAAGCVLAEMINGCPLFSEERCTNQLYAIIKLFGYAPGDLMDGLSSGNVSICCRTLMLALHRMPVEMANLLIIEQDYWLFEVFTSSRLEAFEKAYLHVR